MSLSTNFLINMNFYELTRNLLCDITRRLTTVHNLIFKINSYFHSSVSCYALLEYLFFSNRYIVFVLQEFTYPHFRKL